MEIFYPTITYEKGRPCCLDLDYTKANVDELKNSVNLMTIHFASSGIYGSQLVSLQGL